MEPLLRILPKKPQHLIIRYASTTVLVGLCFLLVLAVRSTGAVPGFFLMFPAIFAAAILFDRASGIYAALLSTGLLYFELRPSQTALLPSEFVGPLIAFFVIALGLAVISEGLRSAWERAVAAEQAKDLLLQELSHRTKNNLAMVVSMLSLQARLKTNNEARAALEKAVLRIQAIARAHDHFRPLQQDGHVEMRPYLETLCRHLGDTLRDVRPIAIRVEVENTSLRTEQAVPVGLIVNELVTNAFKHAFRDDRTGTVEVRLMSTSPHWTLIVKDNGVGCPKTKQERLGSRLTRLLASQIGGTVEWEEPEHGCLVRIRFPGT
jgi:two-component sensor histidine kinase